MREFERQIDTAVKAFEDENIDRKELVEGLSKKVKQMINLDELRLGRDIVSGRDYFGPGDMVQVGIIRMNREYNTNKLEPLLLIRAKDGKISASDLWDALTKSEIVE